jgi:hypothetical protein
MCDVLKNILLFYFILFDTEMGPQSENLCSKLVYTYYESARWKKIPDSKYKNASHEYKFFPRNATENLCTELPL